MLTARSKSATSDSRATRSVGTEGEKNDTDCSLRENSFIHSVRLLKVAPQQGSIPRNRKAGATTRALSVALIRE